MAIKSLSGTRIVLCTVVLWSGPSAAGTWTKIAQLPPAGTFPSNVTLLTDGRILISGGESSVTWAQWWTYTPDSTGAYENSTITQMPIATSEVARLFNPSFTLNTGQYMVCGGEYMCPSSDPICQTQYSDRGECELYDPVANSWTVMPDVPGVVNDTEGVVIPDGRALVLTYDTGNAYLFDVSRPTAWTETTSYNTADMNNEGGSALLPNGSMFLGNWAFGLYTSTTSSWSEAASTATLPGGTQLYEFISPNNQGEGEIGPFLLLYDGTLLILGSNSHNGLYSYATNSWAFTDDSPLYNHGDSPGCVEPDGTALTIVNNDPDGEGSGSESSIYEYNPTASPGQRWIAVAYPPITSGLQNASDRMKMVALPTGQILVTGLENNGAMWLYRPAGTPSASWRPTIVGEPYLFFGNYIINGQQMYGLTSGSDFGDDQKSPTNYPLVTLASSGSVAYARTYGFSNRAPRVNAAGVCQFALPASLSAGTYTVGVTTNGISSGNTAQLTVPAPDKGPELLSAVSLPLT